jgi:hypothetical protein
LLRILEKHDARGWAERPFPKLLSILEKAGATGLGGAPVALRIGGIELASKSYIWLRGSRSVLFCHPGVVSIQQVLQNGDSGAEVIAELHEQVDVIEVFLAVKAVGKVVACIDGGLHFAAVGAEEAEVAFAHFGRRPVAAEGGDRDGHGQVIANSAQQIGVDHDFSEMSDKAKP